MFKKFYTKLLIKIIEYLTSKNFVAFLKSLIIEYVNSPLPPNEKRQQVFNKAKALWPEIKDHLINLAIESIITEIKQ